MSSSKLEMSLDEIIKASKNKDSKNNSGRAGKFGQNKIANLSQSKRKVGIHRIGKSVISKGNRATNATGKRMMGNLRRKSTGPTNRTGGPIRKKSTPLRKNPPLQATKNLVKKLVKKALNQQSNLGVGIVGARRGKFRQRVPLTRVIKRRPILNKINTRSRVIGRRPRIIAVANQQPILVKQGRGQRQPVRYASVQTIPTRAIPPRRTRVQYVQQQQPPIIVQQPTIPRQISVREHINAMRRTSTVRQLQSQFAKQQRQNQPRRQNVYVVQQSRPRPQRQQYIIAQQLPPHRQQFLVRQVRGGGRVQRQQTRRQQQFILDPFYEPANFLQRI